MKDSYIVRLISSYDHMMKRDELMEHIRQTGTDRYDKERKQMFDDFYSKHDVHFFAEATNKLDLDVKIDEMVKEFPHKTLSDRQQEVVPDIAIVYDATKCKMIKNVYLGNQESDCYQFKGNPLDALIEVRELHATR